MANKTPGIVLFFGLPSSGKGTYSQLVSSEFGIPRITISTLLRENGKHKSRKSVDYCMENGLLVLDSFVSELLLERLEKKDCSKGAVLDGFPRTIMQAEELERICKGLQVSSKKAFFLKLPVKVALRRLSDRESCPKCNLTYSLSDYPPKVKGVCNNCFCRLEKRKDDSKKSAARRLQSESLEIKKISSFYRKNKLLKELDASGKGIAVEKNFSIIRKAIERC